MSEMTDEARQFIILTRDVFGTTNGQALLKILEERYLDAHLYSPNLNEVYYNLGKAEFVKSFKNCFKPNALDELQVVEQKAFD